MTDKETIRLYDARAKDYAQIKDSAAPDATLVAFMDVLPPAAYVLDLGCGPGRFAGKMAQAGHRVDAWDASGPMVDLAGALPGVTARQADFDALDVTAVYDGIWANFSLLHAPRADMPRHLGAIRIALKPGGVFHIAVKEGEGSKRDGIGRLYTYFTQAELTALLEDAGLTPGPFKHGEDMGLDNVMARWISVTAHA